MGTPDDFRHWTRETLVSSLIQAEGDIKKLREDNAYLRDEAERYHQESRDNAKTLGGILRVLRENDIEVHPSPGRPVRVKPGQSHQRSMVDDRLGFGPKCVCGAQWLEQAGRCVTHDPKMLAALNIRAERGFE